jgi:hypothetical protein
MTPGASVKLAPGAQAPMQVQWACGVPGAPRSGAAAPCACAGAAGSAP